MAQRKVQIFASPQGEWPVFFQEFFEDTPTQLLAVSDLVAAARDFDRFKPDLIFYEPALPAMSLLQKWQARRAVDPAFRAYQLGPGTVRPEFAPDAAFPPGLPLAAFQRELIKSLPFPESVHVLVTDDEEEIGGMICDFLAQQSQPSFRVDYVRNGALALDFLSRQKPDVLVLDVKMPVMGGIEVFRTLKMQGVRLPVIVFFDAVFGDEIQKLHEIGRPAIVEKGSWQSEMPALLSMIKKMVFFG